MIFDQLDFKEEKVMDNEKIEKLQQMIDESNHIVFFGGAGVSTESHIPDFRSTDGLYHQTYKYPPEVMVSHTFYTQHTEEFYDFYNNKMIFLDAGNEIVIEEFMTGREVSVLAFCDGKTIKCMTSAQDHKRAKDGDQGLNTGGMGTFSPSPFYNDEVEAFCEKYVYQSTIDAMASEGRPFTGILFTGLMITEDGPKVLEYNARFGDPEAQVVLPRMKNDIIDVMEACIDGKLSDVELEFEDNAAVCVVLASDGYPEKYDKGFEIKGLDTFKDKDGYYVFHAGTKFDGDKIVTNGGRVLGVVAKGENLKAARANAYKATEWIDFANKYKRNDIGKAIDEA